MDGLQTVGRANLWHQPVYADFLAELDPYQATAHFRPRSKAYDGSTTFWTIPSPEPALSEAIWALVGADFRQPQLQTAAATLAASIAERYPAYEQLVFVAILRAGVPIADWLTRMLPGSTALATSLFCGLGLDRVALAQVQRTYPDRQLLFVDGWTGRGGVARELVALALGPLAVLFDPWGWAAFAGSREDFLCPSACFTGPTTLGFSRTFYTNAQQRFNAYLFPEKYMRPHLVQAWQNACPQAGTHALPTGERFFKPTSLRLHSNEVVRALINADPQHIYFASSKSAAYEAYRLLLELAEWRAVPTSFDVHWLHDYQSQVACALTA